LPAVHVVHGAQLDALPAALNVPLAHAVHIRSVVVVPAALTAWPAAHAVHGTHAVAGSPSRSQLYSAQACFGATPPGQ